ncbi:MAG: hypothetical protein JST04_01005 [Bdellovibrionales bacterium]|nr:hypothetical protein [Bdellovibrionales bacterium]
MNDVKDLGVDLYEPTKELTFGEKLVGITFNPSNDEKVHKLKSLFAEAANIVKETFEESNSTDAEHENLRKIVFVESIGEILKAQMCAVKLVTIKNQ